MVLVIPRHGPNTEFTQKLSLIQHARQNFAQTIFIAQGEKLAFALALGCTS